MGGGGRKKTTSVIDIATLQSLARSSDIPDLTDRYGFIVVDECHHIPAIAFENAVKQIAAKRWLGLTATPYRRDQLDDLISFQLGPTRYTIEQAKAGTIPSRPDEAPPPERVDRPRQRIAAPDEHPGRLTDLGASGAGATGRSANRWSES